MAMPANQLAAVPVAGTYLSPDDRNGVGLLADFELGGVAVGDPSEGLRVQVWECRVDAGVIQTRPESGGAWTNITSDTSITEVSLAFDQNMRPTVAYMAGGVAKLYWYDSDTPAYTTTSFTGATSPRVLMDDKRPRQTGLSDILLFYLLGGRVLHRVQRDRFAVVYDLAAVPSGTTRIRACGMTDANRIQLTFAA